MNYETKQDVFEELLESYMYSEDIVIDETSTDGVADRLNLGNIIASTRARYAAALPDDLPVIPKAVGDAIKIHKDYAHSLLDIFGVLSIYGVSRTEPSLDYNAWIVHHPDAFARAWVLGVWRVEETGEIVKLEAEK